MRHVDCQLSRCDWRSRKFGDLLVVAYAAIKIARPHNERYLLYRGRAARSRKHEAVFNNFVILRLCHLIEQFLAEVPSSGVYKGTCVHAACLYHLGRHLFSVAEINTERVNITIAKPTRFSLIEHFDRFDFVCFHGSDRLREQRLRVIGIAEIAPSVVQKPPPRVKRKRREPR